MKNIKTIKYETVNMVTLPKIVLALEMLLEAGSNESVDADEVQRRTALAMETLKAAGVEFKK